MHKTKLSLLRQLLLTAVVCAGLGNGYAPVASGRTPLAAPMSEAEPPALSPSLPAPAAADQCPVTPAGAVELAHGCSAVELVRRPARLFGAALTGLQSLSQALGAEDFAEARPAVDATSTVLQQASAALARGEVCAAAAWAQRADSAARDIEGILASTLAKAPATAAPQDDGEGHDAALAQHTRLALGAALVREGLRTVHDTAASAQWLCDVVVESFERRVRIVWIEAPTGLVHLDDGTLVVLAPNGDVQHTFAGREVTMAGLRFADGTALATRVDDEVTMALHSAVSAVSENFNPGPILTVAPCLTLRAVPIQSGYPYPGGIVPAVHHSLAGYTDSSGTVQFENGIGLTPLQNFSTTCPTYNAATHRAILYSVGIVENVAPFTSFTLASDMHEGDGVVFPSADSAFLFNTGHSITATFYQQECTFVGPSICTAPTVLRTETYTLEVADQSALASVNYDTTVVGVVDQQAGYEHNNWYDTLHPTSYTLSASFPSGPTVVMSTFSAEGWRRHADGSFSIDPVHLGTDFIVYYNDWTSIWSNPATPHPLDNIGQDHPSGLRWAHLEGTRNGWPFWYSTRTPHVVRDLIAHCPVVAATDLSASCGVWPPTTPVADTSEPNPRAGQPITLSEVSASFYELPYAAGWQSNVGNMNFDDPASNHRHGCNQIGAYDFGNVLKAPLLAARGGTVIFVESNLSATCKCLGNRIFIRHQDGTMAVYYHEIYQGVVVNKDDVVHRGQQIGLVGQTGNAGGPHVHWEALVWESSDYGGIRSLFRARVGSKIATPTNCYLPRSNDTFFSTTVQQ
jgi:hypothetical protein